MADPKHPRRFTEEFKRQIVELYNNGKPMREILGVPRSTYYSMRGRGEKPKQPDPLTPEVVLAYEAIAALTAPAR